MWPGNSTAAEKKETRQANHIGLIDSTVGFAIVEIDPYNADEANAKMCPKLDLNSLMADLLNSTGMKFQVYSK